MSALATPGEVLAFWFGDVDAPDARWFNGGAAFDAEIARRFGATIDAAVAGTLDGWAGDAGTDLDGTLALIVVLDQFTRNVHRGTPRAFAGDPRALALATGLVDAGLDRRLPPLRRWFAYLPFEHAEHLAVQQRSVRLFEALAADAGAHAATLASALDYARRHRDVVARFGRFPHRNAILGRASSDEEAAFLREPGSRF